MIVLKKARMTMTECDDKSKKKKKGKMPNIEQMDMIMNRILLHLSDEQDEDIEIARKLAKGEL